MRKKMAWTFALAACLFASCDDDAATVGLVPDSDNAQVAQAMFDVTTKSVKSDSVLAKTTTCYLGRIADLETNSTIASDFMAQYYVPEGYEFPDYEGMQKDEDGRVEIDSIEIRLYFDQFYGDSLNAMKISVFELDTLNVLNETESYYSNVDPLPYINSLKQEPIVRKVFSVNDLTISDSARGSASHYKNVRVVLPKAYGNFIANKYYENPDYFKNSFNFIRHVVPGFYFKLESGEGTMLYVDVSSINLFFKYEDSDSIYNGVTRFASTGEVIQCTRIANDNLDKLVAQDECTYVKSPAGIFTEIELPVADIYEGHERDSVNSAKVIFTRYNNSTQDPYNLGTPQRLLMLRKADMHSFFEKNKVTDSETSFLTSYNSSTNTYTYDNIAKLIAYCKNERNRGAAEEEMSVEEWEAKNPDWNKAVLVPVSVTTSSSGTITRITHDLSLNSTRLIGGESKIPMQVIYSRFFQ